MNFHTPILYDEVLEILVRDPHGTYVDCTMGEGGHSLGILGKLSEQGKLISLDQDPHMVAQSLERYPDNRHWIRIQENFRNLKSTLKEKGIFKVDGILADLGISMFHYKASERGFTFAKEESLEMSLSQGGLTAKEIIHKATLEELQNLLWEYGEEPHAHRIASFIIYYREKVGPITTTTQLADIVSKALFSIGDKKKKSHIHVATKTFQALRIAVNDELGALEGLLKDSLEILKEGGRAVLISYHSLEDRRVKEFILANQKSIKFSSKKPITPSNREVLENKASRSAKLRFFER